MHPLADAEPVQVIFGEGAGGRIKRQCENAEGHGFRPSQKKPLLKFKKLQRLCIYESGPPIYAVHIWEIALAYIWETPRNCHLHIYAKQAGAQRKNPLALS